MTTLSHRLWCASHQDWGAPAWDRPPGFCKRDRAMSCLSIMSCTPYKVGGGGNAARGWWGRAYSEEIPKCMRGKAVVCYNVVEHDESRITLGRNLSCS